MMRQPSTHIILGSCLFFDCFALNWFVWNCRKSRTILIWTQVAGAIYGTCCIALSQPMKQCNIFCSQVFPGGLLAFVDRSQELFGNKPEEGPFNNLSPQVSHLSATTTTVPQKWNWPSCMTPFTVTFSFGQQGTTLSLFI